MGNHGFKKMFGIHDNGLLKGLNVATSFAAGIGAGIVAADRFLKDKPSSGAGSSDCTGSSDCGSGDSLEATVSGKGDRNGGQGSDADPAAAGPGDAQKVAARGYGNSLFGFLKDSTTDAGVAARRASNRLGG